MTTRTIPSSVLLSGSNSDPAGTTTRMTKVAIAQVFAADAFAGWPSACQFFMCTKAPNAGLNRRLQLAAAFAFHSGGIT